MCKLLELWSHNNKKNNSSNNNNNNNNKNNNNNIETDNNIVDHSLLWYAISHTLLYILGSILMSAEIKVFCFEH